MRFWEKLAKDKYDGGKGSCFSGENAKACKDTGKIPNCLSRFRSVSRNNIAKLKNTNLHYVMAPFLLLTGYVGVSLGISAATPAAATTVPQQLNTFVSTGSLPQSLIGATATLLDNGDVLVAGGSTGSVSSPAATNAAELYNPSTGTFLATSPLPTALYDATATLLDNGDVLVAGGLSSTGTALASAELYNPASAAWTQVSAMATPTFNAAATVMGNGEVLIVGGQTGSLPSGTTTSTPTSTTTTAAPVTTTSSTTTTSSAVTTTSSTTTTTIPPVTSYSATASAELFDPASNSFVTASSLGTGLADTTATLLGNGDVLIAGGLTGTGSSEVPSNEAYVFVPPPTGQTGPGTMTKVGVLPIDVASASADRLPNGDVLVAGGKTVVNNVWTASAGTYLYNPATSSFSATAQLSTGHDKASMTQLPDGNILIAGGITGNISAGQTTSAAEIYNTATSSWSGTGSLVTARAGADCVLIAGGYVLFTGGFTSTGSALSAAELYFGGIQPSFTSVGRGIFVAGRSHSVLITATGSPAPTFSESGPLPQGLTFSDLGGGKAEIAGIPASGSEGVYSILITASNGLTSPSQSYSLIIRYPAVTGYLEVGQQGKIYNYGSAKSMSNLSFNPRLRRVVAVVSTADGKGYYVVTQLGNIFNYGDAKFHGSHARGRLPHPVTAFQTVDNGEGYYIVTSAGNIYNYGSAQFYGSTAHINLKSPVTSMAVTPNGHGYWLVTASGNVYPFGNAVGYSHLSVNPRVRKIVAILPDSSGQGYWLVSRLGNVYNYGNAGYYS